MTPTRPAISAIVTCYNEERHIAACLESLRWCDEILVVDSYSTDRTPEIARSFDKVRLLQREYYGGASQKNWAMDRARHDWLLIFDSDERCTPELRAEIEALLASGPPAEAFTIRRNAFFLGKRIRFCGWHNERVVRLLKRDAGRYDRRRVHARLVTRGPAPQLRSAMDHYMVEELDEYMRRILKYGHWGAAQAWRDGKQSGTIAAVGRPLWRFVRAYGLQLGFLDGVHGLMFCVMQAAGTYVKWATLWGWQANAARGIEPDLPEFDDDEEVWRGLERIRATGSAVAHGSPVRPNGGS